MVKDFCLWVYVSRSSITFILQTSFEDQLFELRNEIEQKDKLVAYLQSIVQPKQTQKLPQRPRSSLLSSESEFISVRFQG